MSRHADPFAGLARQAEDARALREKLAKANDGKPVAELLAGMRREDPAKAQIFEALPFTRRVLDKGQPAAPAALDLVGKPHRMKLAELRTRSAMLGTLYEQNNRVELEREGHYDAAPPPTPLRETLTAQRERRFGALADTLENVEQLNKDEPPDAA